MSKYNLMGGGLGGGTDYAIARRIVDLHSRMEESVERVYAVVSHVQIQLGEGLGGEHWLRHCKEDCWSAQ